MVTNRLRRFVCGDVQVAARSFGCREVRHPSGGRNSCDLLPHNGQACKHSETKLLV
jgi:hypothetical protein